MEGDMNAPMSFSPLISTGDVEKAQSFLSKEMVSLRFRKVRNRNRFSLTMNGIRLGRTLVAFNQFGEETEVDAGTVEDAVIFTLCVGPPAVPYLDGEPISPDRGAISSPRKHLVVHRATDSAILILRTTKDVIEERFQEETGRRPNKPIVFDPSIDITQGVGGEVKRLLHFVIEQGSRDGSALQYPLLRSGLDDMLLNALLSLPNNYSTQMETCLHPPVAPGLVRRAEEYLEAHAAEPISISDVAAHCGCSRRTLFSLFQRYRGYPPMQLLAEFRLTLAWNALQSPSPEDTVTSIAYASGFVHLGRFARLYRERFGESPSHTLREARITNCHH
jgi:AraC-like DNA-binding protein